MLIHIYDLHDHNKTFFKILLNEIRMKNVCMNEVNVQHYLMTIFYTKKSNFDEQKNKFLLITDQFILSSVGHRLKKYNLCIKNTIINY